MCDVVLYLVDTVNMTQKIKVNSVFMGNTNNSP